LSTNFVFYQLLLGADRTCKYVYVSGNRQFFVTAISTEEPGQAEAIGVSNAGESRCSLEVEKSRVPERRQV
jgi:hypothetical protein